MNIHVFMIATSIVLWTSAAGAGDSFIESFNGSGPYASQSGEPIGLDNPDWVVEGDRELRDGGYAFFSQPRRDGTDGDLVFREVSVDCGFVDRIEMKNVSLSPVNQDGIISTENIFLSHFLENHGRLTIMLVEGNDSIDDWQLNVFIPDKVNAIYTVPSGSEIALEIRYDAIRSEASVLYDHDLLDMQLPMSFGPYRSDGATELAFFQASATGNGIISGLLDYWSLEVDCESMIGDFNGSEALDVADIDLLTDVVRLGTNDAKFDLNSDELVDGFDRTAWVETLRKTYFGDSNLDGEFNSTDLVTVFQASEYEDSFDDNSTWSTGDWSGDAEFNSRDLVTAFTSGGYESGPRAALNSVPEPTLFDLSSVAGLFCLARSRRLRRR